MKECSYYEMVVNIYNSIPYQNLIIANNNYFIIPNTYSSKSNLFVLDNNSQYKIGEINLKQTVIFDLNFDNVLVGKINDSNMYACLDKYNSEEIRLVFYKSLLSHQSELIKKQLHFVMNRLESRFFENKPLLNNQSIQIALAEVIGLIEELKATINDKKLSPLTTSVSIYIRRIITSINNRLSKLGGGISFIRGSILEMLYILQIINNIYFSGDNLMDSDVI